VRSPPTGCLHQLHTVIWVITRITQRRAARDTAMMSGTFALSESEYTSGEKTEQLFIAS